MTVPNPGSDRVEIFSVTAIQIMEVKLTDMHGRTLMHEPVNAFGHTLNTKGLQPAVYIIHCTCENGNTYPVKWVKQ